MKINICNRPFEPGVLYWLLHIPVDEFMKVIYLARRMGQEEDVCMVCAVNQIHSLYVGYHLLQALKERHAVN